MDPAAARRLKVEEDVVLEVGGRCRFALGDISHAFVRLPVLVHEGIDCAVLEVVEAEHLDQIGECTGLRG